MAVHRACRLADVRRKVADGEADPSLGGRVGLRPVDELDVMERHLPRLKLERHGLALVHVDVDLLPAAEQTVGRERVPMGYDV